MKKYISLILILTLVLVLAACREKSAGDKPVIVTSIYPVYDFASKLAGDRAVVINLTATAGEVHDWEPSTGDMVSMQNCSAFIYSGLGIDFWVENALAGIDTSEITICCAGDGVDPLPAEEHGHDGHDHGDSDPHIWLDPMRAKIMLGNIKDALTASDPEGAEYYQKNYDMYAEALDTLDGEYTTALSDTKQSTIIVSHEAYGYLCDRYGLTQVGIEGINAEGDPDPGTLAGLVSFAKDNGIKVVFYEPGHGEKTAEALARDIGGQAVRLNPLETLSGEGDYFSVMRENLQALLTALNG